MGWSDLFVVMAFAYLVVAGLFHKEDKWQRTLITSVQAIGYALIAVALR